MVRLLSARLPPSISGTPVPDWRQGLLKVGGRSPGGLQACPSVVDEAPVVRNLWKMLLVVSFNQQFKARQDNHVPPR